MKKVIKYFNEEDTIFEITEKYEETIPVFTSNGFHQMTDKNKRETLGSSISLKDALLLKGKNYDTFSALLINSIESVKDDVDITLSSSQNNNQDNIKIMGALPCPVRIPLLESIANFAKEYEKSHKQGISYDLKAASEGVSWIEEKIEKVKDPNDLPDIFISAGFETFFDPKRIGKFKDLGIFKDAFPHNQFNSSFADNALSDPNNHYSVISVVPAVFLVNTDELNGREIPKTWEDILKPCYEQSVSLPVGDFDLFASILLNIHKQYGVDGVKCLGKSLLQALHPAQMVKSEKKKTNRPAITIMPYFFTKMVKEGGSMQAIWPEDGAIISPIFMLCKKSKLAETQSIIDFLSSQEVGEILAHKGLFPSTNPKVDNKLSKTNKFMWLGWDYIYNNNIPELIQETLKIFNVGTPKK